MTMATAPVVMQELVMHNSGSRLRKRCSWRWHIQEVQGWIPRKRAVALYLGSAIDRALKAYYHYGSRKQLAEDFEEQQPGNVSPYISVDPEGRWVWELESDVDWEEELAFRENASWEALNDYLMDAEDPELPDDDPVKMAASEIRVMAHRMWVTYLEMAQVEGSILQRMEIVAVDWPFKGPVSHEPYVDPDGQQVLFYYAGEFDGIVILDNKLHLLENKTSINMMQLINSLDRDEQASRYWWALVNLVRAGRLEHLGVNRDIELGGTIFNILSKTNMGVPTFNKITKKEEALGLEFGKISKSTGANTQLAMYMRAMEERKYSFVPDSKAWPRGKAVVRMPDSVEGVRCFVRGKVDLREFLSEEFEDQHRDALIRVSETVWVTQHIIDRNDAMLAMTHSQLYAEMVDDWRIRHHPEQAYRTPNFMCANECPFVSVCNASLRGEPIAGLLEEFYTTKAELEAEKINSVPVLVNGDYDDGGEGYGPPVHDIEDLPF